MTDDEIDDADLVDDVPPQRVPARRTPRVYVATNTKTKTGRRRKRFGKTEDPKWFEEIRKAIDNVATLEKDLKTARTRRNYEIWLACHVHGASTMWMARKLGVSNVRVIDLERAGAEAAMLAGLTAEAAYEAMYGPDVVDEAPGPTNGSTP